MATARSRIAKGRSFQKKICELVKATFDDLTEDDIRTAVGAEAGVDIKLSRRGREIVGLSIECKNVKSLNVWEALKQAEANNYDDCCPAVVFHRSVAGNKQSWIAVPVEHYFDMRKELRRLMEKEELGRVESYFPDLSSNVAN